MSFPMHVVNLIRGLRVRQPATKIILPLVVIGLLVYYQSMYAFSFFPITEGWFSLYAKLVREGYIPHRDFSLLMPPLYTLHLAMIQSLFGESIWVLRVVGVGVTCGIGVTLWALISRFFSPWISAFAASVGIIYYQTGNAFIGYDFTQFLTLYLLLGGWLLTVDLQWIKKAETSPLWKRASFFAGMCLAAAILTKQSNGGIAGFVLSVTYTFIVFRIQRPYSAIHSIASLGLGAICIFSPIVIWLAANGAFYDFIQQVFFSAMAAKGGGQKIFTGWVFGVFNQDSYPAGVKALAKIMVNLTILCAGPSIMLAVLFSYLRRNQTLNISYLWGLKWTKLAAALISLLGMIGIVIIVAESYSSTRPLLTGQLKEQAMLIYNMAILMSIHLYAIGFAIGLICLAFIPSERVASFVMLFALGIGLTMGNGSSAGLSEISAFVGLAITISFLMTIAMPAIVPSLIPVALSLLLTSFLVDKKFSEPYSWWTVKAPAIRTDKCERGEGLLKGLCVDSDNQNKINSLILEIEKNTNEADELYVFPHMPIFNLMSNRAPFDNMVVSWFDFTSVDRARHLITSLETRPPKAILIARLDESVFSTHEMLFNAGKASVQREIVRAIDSQLAAGLFYIKYAMKLNGTELQLLLRRTQ